MRKKRISRTVKLRKRNNVVAHLRNVDDRVLDRRHSGTNAKRIDSALERRHALFQHGIGGIPDTGINIAFNF